MARIVVWPAELFQIALLDNDLCTMICCADDAYLHGTFLSLCILLPCAMFTSLFLSRARRRH